VSSYSMTIVNPSLILSITPNKIFSLVMSAINTGGVVSNPLPISDTLFFKIQGDKVAIDAASKQISAIVKKHGSSKFEFAQTDAEADDLWHNRKYALMSTLAAHPGSRCWTTDVW
jgi:D-lactate dehydrogenase (cytochrome)